MDTFGLIIDAVVAGLMLGGFYAAAALGVTISFGMLGIVNIAHPAFMILGAYLVLLISQHTGIDPLLGGLVLTPLFFMIGALIYRFYYLSFEKKGGDSLLGLVFFFGLLFLIEAGLILVFGVDMQSVHTSYTDVVLRPGPFTLPLRLTLPFVVSLAMLAGLYVFLKKTYFGRWVLAVSQDESALQLMGVNPTRVKRIAFALSIATAVMSGAMLLVIQSVQPSLGREYIGIVFAVCILAGMGSIPGTLVGALILGLVEAFTATFLGASWAPAASFGLLLLMLTLRPEGIFGR
ncbi:Branched-chain amino acid transport system permease protein OS=Castellaniella defragrans OX=75697 GN=HNR28_000956 PE=3 SV=1 [Castellaniella defragrans]